MPKYDPEQAQQFIRDLQYTLQLFTEHSKGVSEGQSCESPDAKTWSAVQLLSHLHSCQDVWGNSIFYMLIEDTVVLPDIHPSVWERQMQRTDRLYADMFMAFRHTRLELVHVLTRLNHRDWQRSATTGKRTVTVVGQVRRMALHEKNSHWE